MSLRYEINALATVFYKLNGENRNPTEARLKAIEDEFFKDYEGRKNILGKAMDARNIRKSKENKSAMLLLIKMNSVGGSREDRAKAACKFFVESEMESRGRAGGPAGEPV